MKKYVFESLKFFCAAILCTILSAFTTPSRAALPDGYTELEYIEGTGTQYITTDITANQDTSAEIKFVPTSVYQFNAVFGARASKTSNAFNVWVPMSSGFFGMNYSNLGAIESTTRPVLNDTYTIYLSKTKFSVNDDIINISGGTDFVTPGGIQIFNIYGSESVASTSSAPTNRIASGKVYYFKIWQNNTLTHNFIPAKNSSGKIGMYDTVTNTFFTNAGTGEFVAGAPVTDNSCRNLADMTEQNIMVGKYVSAEGIISNSEHNFTYMTFIPVKPNTTYTLSFSSPLYFASVSEYSTASDGGFITRQTKYSTSITEPFDLTDFTFTTGATTNYVRWGSNMYKARAITLNDVLSLNYMFEEGDTATSYVPYCEKIKIATTKYNETAFGPLNTALQNAISVVDSVVTQTITQAGRIADLQAQKQTRPNDIADDNEKCPAGKKCLLVTDENNVPHWYEIVEKYSRLPDGYTELEYIESTGTQYIDTGIYGTEHHGMEIKFNFPTLSSTYSGRLCGGRTGTGAANAFAYIGTNLGTQAPTNNTFYVSSNNVLVADLEPVDTNVHTVSVNLSNNQKSYFDGQEIQGIGKTTAYVHQFTTNLFRAYNGSSGWADPTPARIYFCKITNSGELVRDFVPAKNADGKIGMYDLVNGVFYENKGTGEFIGGQPVFN